MYMPRYPVSTYLNQDQIKKVDEAVKILGKSKYVVLRDAVLTYCEAIIKEKNESERRKEDGKKGESSSREDFDRDFEPEVGRNEPEDIFG
jgi:hypothetical protein